MYSIQSHSQQQTVVLGGGDYACFTARALSDGFGVDVNLVTTRPMSLKDTPLNPLRGSKGELIMGWVDVWVGLSKN